MNPGDLVTIPSPAGSGRVSGFVVRDTRDEVLVRTADGQRWVHHDDVVVVG